MTIKDNRNPPTTKNYIHIPTVDIPVGAFHTIKRKCFKPCRSIKALSRLYRTATSVWQRERAFVNALTPTNRERTIFVIKIE